MSEQMPVDVDLRNVQETVEDSVKKAQEYGRRAYLATIGMWGLGYDKAQDFWKGGMSVVDKAEKRGEELEHAVGQQFGKIQENRDLKKVRGYVEDQVDGVSKNAKSVVAEVERFLMQFQPKVEEVAKDVKIQVEGMLEAVIEGYDEMIVLRDIEYESHCEHHMAPIIGRAHVGYLPTGKVGHFQIAGVPERHEPDIGEINYPYLFALLDSLGYDGWIGCEYRPKAGTSAGLGWLRPWLGRR